MPPSHYDDGYLMGLLDLEIRLNDPRTKSVAKPPKEEEWPYGPPSFHENCCSLHSGRTFCDCRASAADDTKYGRAP